MLKTILKYTMLLTAVLLWSCEPNTDEFTPANGSADFSKFVAIGDSYTAGYTDGALGRKGQESGFSYILGQQLAYVGSNSYNQPLVQSEGSVGTTDLPTGGKNGYLKLELSEAGIAPVPTVGDMSIFADEIYSPDNQNFGVPGAKVIHLGELPDPSPSYAQLNPFFKRFASSDQATVIGDAMAANPSFVSLWIGGNDVLTYALTGGEDDAITPSAMFDYALSEIAKVAFGSGQQGVIANVPGIDALPYFTTIPYNAFTIDAKTAAVLNSKYEQYNLAAKQMGLAEMVFSEGSNAFVIYDETIPAQLGSRRQATSDDRLLLTAKAEAQSWTATSDPILGNEFVLTTTELDEIRNATNAYNETIKGISKQYGLAHVDLYAIMKELSEKGLVIDGHKYSAAFVSGGAFSLDGLHATGRGSAIIANAFIEAINTTYKANVPLANVNDYDMVEFP